MTPGAIHRGVLRGAVLLAGVFALFAATAGAQNPPRQGDRNRATQQPARDPLRPNSPNARPDARDEGTPFFGEGSEASARDTVKKRRPRQPLESYFFVDSIRKRHNVVWRVSPETNNLEISAIDTLQNDFQNGYPFQKRGVGSVWLGNLGSPAQYLSFFDRQHSTNGTLRSKSTLPSFAAPWEAYLRTPATTPFYNVKRAFTQLGYTWAGQKAKQEEDLGVIHAQNITPSTGFNIDYSSLGTRGIYAWQATRDKHLSLGVNHTGKRYTVHAAYVYNSVVNRENGGMVDDDDILLNISRWEMTQNIPMRLSDARNTIKNHSYFFTQSYGVPLRRVYDDDFTIADRPAFFVGHSFEYNRWSRRYEDTAEGTVYKSTEADRQALPYYENRYFNANSRDSLFDSRLANRVFVQIQPWNRAGVVGTIDGGVGVDVRRFYQFSLDQYFTGAKKRYTRETEYYVYAAARGNVRQYFDWGARFKFHPFGDAAGDIEVGGNVAARVFVKGRPLSVSGNFSFSSLRPDRWLRSFSSNHFRWDNSFTKENETRFDVSLSVPHIGFSATGSQSILSGRVYFGVDGLPAQASKVVSLTGVYLREDLRIRTGSSSVNLNHRVMLQWSTDHRIVPVPLVAAYLSYYYEFNVVKNVLRLQVGVDGRYNTRWWAPGYNPGTGQFYNQSVKQLGNYVWMDVFVNAKWKRMRIILKLEHLSDDMFGSRNYFTVLHYPTNRRILKIGFSWNFYD